MTITNTIKVIFTEEERINWLDAYWGCFTRESNTKVANTVIGMLEKGVTSTLLRDNYKFIEEVGRLSGVTEVTDSEARSLVCERLDIVSRCITVPTFFADNFSEDSE